MARGRMITKEVSKSKKTPKLSPETLNLFFMLIPHYDSYGKMNGDPAYIKGEVVPRFERFTMPKIKRCLSEISKNTNVKWFSIKGLWYLHSLNFKEHQKGLRADRMGVDHLPNYPRATPGGLPDHSRTTPGELHPEVEVEVEGEGEKEVKEEVKGEGGGEGKPNDEESFLKKELQEALQKKDTKRRDELIKQLDEIKR